MEMGYAHEKKRRKKSKGYVKDWSTEGILHQSRDSYEEEIWKRGDDVQLSGSGDELQLSCNQDYISEKRKRKLPYISEKRKRKLPQREQTNLSGYQNKDEHQSASVSQSCENSERTEERSLPADGELLPCKEEHINFDEIYHALLVEAECDVALPDELRMKLKNLEILVPFGTHPSHSIETRVTHAPTEEQRNLLASLGVQLQYKKFNKNEDDIIHRNWKQFRRKYDFGDQEPFQLFIQNNLQYLKKSERKHFVQYLGNGLEHRTLYSIYGRFQTLYSTRIQGKFSEAEDEVIWQHMSNRMDLKAFSTLSKMLNRERLSVYKRFKWLRNKIPQRKGRVTWTIKKAGMVVNSLLKITGSKKVEDLQNKHISSEDWRKVESDCNIKAKYIQFLWNTKLSTQLFASKPVYLNKIRIKIIERLYKDRVKWWQDIKWTDIARDFGVSSMFLWAVCRKLIKSFNPSLNWQYIRDHFRDIIEDLMVNHIQTIRSKTEDYRLQRLRMTEDGELFALEEKS